MKNTRPTQGGGMPGYTGYQSAQVREEQEAAQLAETTRRQQEENDRHRNRVPGYQGYVPQIKSENVFGATFGSTTAQQKEGSIKSGFDCDNAERYNSVAQRVYTDQMQQHVFGANYQKSGAAQTTGGSVQMPFEQAKKIADQKRKEQFEINKKKFFGEDGWDQNAFKGSSNQFWGC